MVRADVLVHPEAAAEYAEARRWYADRSEALGTSFEREIERATRLIAENPDRWPQYGDRYRRFVVRRFPYLGVYFTAGEQVWILAVAHAHRRPGYWRHRQPAE